MTDSKCLVIVQWKDDTHSPERDFEEVVPRELFDHMKKEFEQGRSRPFILGEGAGGIQCDDQHWSANEGRFPRWNDVDDREPERTAEDVCFYPDLVAKVFGVVSKIVPPEGLSGVFVRHHGPSEPILVTGNGPGLSGLEFSVRAWLMPRALEQPCQ